LTLEPLDNVDQTVIVVCQESQGNSDLPESWDDKDQLDHKDHKDAKEPKETQE